MLRFLESSVASSRILRASRRRTVRAKLVCIKLFGDNPIEFPPWVFQALRRRHLSYPAKRHRGWSVARGFPPSTQKRG